MGHVGVICPNTPGHLNPMTALGDALRRRDHRVTFFLLGDPPRSVTSAGFEVVPLAVQRFLDGYSTEEVAEFLGVDPRSVRRWMAAYRRHGGPGLLARPASGRPPKLTTTQEKIVRRWLADSPAEHGFETELWTASRIGQLIREEFGVRLNPRYLSSWLRDRGFTPQTPQRVPRERDPKAIATWLESDWPRIKKRPGGTTPP